MKIPLPIVITTAESAAHPYPFQIAQQTLEFMQCALFYNIISDLSSGEHVKNPDNISNIKSKYFDGKINEETWESAWGYMEKYKNYFELYVFQNVLIAINSHWDWYIRNIANFVVNSRKHVTSPKLTIKQEKYITRIGFEPIAIQISLLELSAGLDFGISQDIINDLKEMSYVRNLCLHNRMEVDEKYINNSSNKLFSIGDLRIINKDELISWHNSFNESIRSICTKISIKYVTSPINR